MRQDIDTKLRIAKAQNPVKRKTKPRKEEKQRQYDLFGSCYQLRISTAILVGFYETVILDDATRAGDIASKYTYI